MIMTVVTVLFAPITFVSSYFGMNFAGGKGLDHPFVFCERVQAALTTRCPFFCADVLMISDSLVPCVPNPLLLYPAGLLLHAVGQH